MCCQSKRSIRCLLWRTTKPNHHNSYHVVMYGVVMEGREEKTEDAATFSYCSC